VAENLTSVISVLFAVFGVAKTKKTKPSIQIPYNAKIIFGCSSILQDFVLLEHLKAAET
jgi:hypothetical protein